MKTPTIIFACQCPRMQEDIRPCKSIGRRSGASIQCLSARGCTCSVEGSWLEASWLHSSQRHLHSGIMSRAGQSCAPFWITCRVIEIMELGARVLVAFLASQVKHISVHGIIILFAAHLLMDLHRRPMICVSDYQLRYGIYLDLFSDYLIVRVIMHLFITFWCQTWVVQWDKCQYRSD